MVTGTNVLSSPISSEAIFFLLEQANKFEVKIIIDLNWREVFWDNSRFSLGISNTERINLIKKNKISRSSRSSTNRIFSEDFDVIVDGNTAESENNNELQDDQRFNTERHHKKQHKF